METQVDPRVEEAQVRQLLEDWAKAAREKDLDALMACYAPEIVSFDLIPPLQYVGADAYRKDWQQGFEMCQASGDFETRDLNLVVGDEVSFCHQLTRMSGTDRDGKSFDGWIRWTQCLRKIDGRWLIAHEHISVPIDMGTNQGLMDLKP